MANGQKVARLVELCLRLKAMVTPLGDGMLNVRSGSKPEVSDGHGMSEAGVKADVNFEE